MKACGVCRTDLHVVDGELPDPSLPCIPGHEVVGEIIAIGVDVAGLAEALIACPSVTPAAGLVFDCLEAQLAPLGFAVHRAITGEAPEGPVENLFAVRHGPPGSRHFAFAGHVDVVPFELMGKSLRVHRTVLPAFTRVRARLTALCAEQPALREFLVGLGGTFVVRNIAGTTRRSAHSYGVSLDVNVALSHYWRWQRPAAPLRWQNRIPQAIVDAFEAEGFIWGGRWYHYDTMHFEYRPELLDAACYPAARAAPADAETPSSK